MVVVCGGCWAATTMVPPLLAFACIGSTMVMCVAALASHFVADIVDPDIADGASPEAIHALPTLDFHAHDPNVSPLTIVSLSLASSFTSYITLAKR